MRQSDRTTRHDGHRRTRDDDVAGVGELRAVAERILDAGARALESGRDWLTARSRGGHAPADEDGGDRRPGGGTARRHRASGDVRWPDDAARSAGAAGVHGADTGRSNAERRHRGEDGGGPRHRAGHREESGEPYAPDEYAYPESGGHASAGRNRHGDHDHGSGDVDARRPEQQAGRDRRIRGIGPYARESGRSFGPRAREHGAADPRVHSGRDHGFDHLPGSFGYGGEYRRDLSALPGDSGPGGDGPGPGGRGHDDAGGPGRRMGHAGRGPKGYTRADERILDDVNERLSDDPLVDARDIEVRCDQGTITLGGRVGARWVKHRAEDIADSVAGVKDIDNRIRVGPADPAAARDASAATRTPAPQAAGPDESAGDRTDRDPPPQQPH
jgi:hypothetical protein